MRPQPIFPLSIKRAVALAVLCLVIIAIYSPVFHADYVNWDDKVHLIDNPLIVDESGSFLFKVLSKEDTVNRTYIPLTAISFYLEKHLFGLTAFNSHCINLGFHIFNVGLIVILGLFLGLNFFSAYLAAFLFAIHPMHVESVAWVTERKDVLYGFFYLLSLIFYCRFLDSGYGSSYIKAFLMAVLSVLAKPMALSLPLALILIDLLKQRRLTWGSFLEKVPFAAVALLIAGITFLQNSRPVSFVFPSSFLIWCWTAFFYLRTFFLPLGLSPLYDIPLPVTILNPEYSSALLGVAALGGLVFLLGKKKCRWVIFAVGFYALSSFFLWRFDCIDPSIVADRFMYLPSLGICFLIGYGFEKLRKGYRSIEAAGILLLIAVLICLAITANFQTGYWRNSWTLWNRVLELRPDLYYAHYMRAQSVLDKEFYKKTAPYFENYIFSRLAFRPETAYEKDLVRPRLKYFKSFFVLRCYRHELTRSSVKKTQFQEIPLEMTYSGYVKELLLIGNYKRALEYTVKKSLKYSLKANDFIVIGRCYTNQGFYAKAYDAYSQAINKDPKNYDAFLSRGAVAVLLGDEFLAFKDIEQLLLIDPKATGAYNLLFNIFVATNKLHEAKAVLDREMTLWPSDPQVFWHRGVFEQKSGNIRIASELILKARNLGFVP